MASVKKTATLNPVESVPEHARPGRKRRPYDYSQFKKAFRNPEDFAFFLAGYPDMSGVLAYWYRLKPKIDLSRIGQDATNLMTTINPAEMTETFAAEKWGSGKYMLKFTDANRRSDQQEMARAFFEVDDPALPAKYDPRCLLLNDPVNADEVERLLAAGVLVREGEYGAPRLKTEANAGPSVVVAPAPAVPPPQTFGSLGDQLIIKLLDRALPSATPPTANEYLKQSFEIADRFRSIDARPQPTLDEIAEAVAAKIAPKAAASPPTFTSELEVYERVGTLLDKVGAGRSLGADSSAVPGWAVFLGPLLDQTVKPLVPLLVQYFSRGLAPAAPVPLTLNAGAAAPAAPATPAAPGPLVLLPASAPLMDRARQVAELGIRKCAEGVEGSRYAAWLCGYYPGGGEVFGLFCSAGGSAGAMGFISMDPVLGSMLRDPTAAAQFTVWLDDFFSFSPDGDGDEEDEEDEQPVEAAVAAATA